MRICSFFSSATELLYALGLGRSIVGRSERCDYPPSVLRQPIIVRSRIASNRLSSRGIHEAVQTLRRRGEHHYTIDVTRLKRLRPDLVVTQELCNVCAASHPEVLDAIQQLRNAPRVVSISAGRLPELFEAIEALGQATGRPRQAKRLREQLQRQVETIQRRVGRVQIKPRVWCAEWLDPLMAAGHWIPEMIIQAGGIDGLGTIGKNSVSIPWDTARRYDPEVILVMPCSFSIARTVKEFPLLTRQPGWSSVSAVKTGRVFAVEGAWFHRPGPRLVHGLKLMAKLFHPTLFPRVSTAAAQALRT